MPAEHEVAGSIPARRTTYQCPTEGSITGMKLSVSLPEADVEFLDEYARLQGIESRSAALHRAIRLLRATGLGSAYEEAWQEWSGTEDADLWETTSADGLKSR